MLAGPHVLLPMVLLVLLDYYISMAVRGWLVLNLHLLPLVNDLRLSGKLDMATALSNLEFIRVERLAIADLIVIP